MRRLLICIVFIGVFVIPALATQYELKWDDGVHNGSYWTSGYKATTFTAPYDLEIISMKIFWYNCSTVNSCDLDIYSDNGGEPGTGLFSAPVTGTIPIGG